MHPALAHPMALAAPAAPRDDLRLQLEGREVAGYVLGERLGRGGMGVVHAAIAPDGTRRAIKLMHPHLADDPELTRMFYDEASVAARIDDPHVCRVHDFGRQGDLLYLVMDELRGASLATVLAQRGRLPLWLAARIVAQAARGLHAAHELTDDRGRRLGVVHRDVSPQNVVLSYDGVAKVVDFGVARARGRLASTAEGILKGKLAYMSPEQIEELPLDRRSDVWGLGVILWETLAGERLFRRESHLDVVTAVLTADVPPIQARRPECPDALAAIVARALEEEPLRRFPTALALAEALEAYLDDLAEGTAPSDPARVADWLCTHVDARTAETEPPPTPEEPATAMTPRTLRSRDRDWMRSRALLGLGATGLFLLGFFLALWGNA